MYLTKKHIGKLVHTAGSDGSWVYQVIDIRDGWALFYSFDNRYWKENIKLHDDWRIFKPQPWSKGWIERGWETAKETLV